MTTRTGNNGVVSVGGNPIGELNSWSLEMTANQIPDTAMGDQFNTSKSGRPSATGTIEVHYDPGDTVQESLVPGTTVALILYPDTTASGSPRISLTAQITGRTRSGAQEEILPQSFNFALSEGTVTEDVVP